MCSPRRDRRTRSRRWFAWKKSVARRTDDRPAKRIVSAAGWREDLMYALREEDDILENQTGRWPRYFYPRPPRGGRHFAGGQLTIVGAFLSTPSVRRATLASATRNSRNRYFYPRPPRGGRPFTVMLAAPMQNFYPRPPRGGRRNAGDRHLPRHDISIHALREEGDRSIGNGEAQSIISIHALCEEGDFRRPRAIPLRWNFYPRPPRGGRRRGL